jgi:hypothetical protein
VCNHSKVAKKSVPHKKLLEAVHSARKIAEAALIARLWPLCALLYPRLRHVQTFKSRKEKCSTQKIAGGSAFCTKNCRGGADRWPSAALHIIVPKTLARAGIQKSQRKTFHMKNRWRQRIPHEKSPRRR